MLDNLATVIPFVLITTFTPGPNNISSASMGVLHGYKETLNYLLGIVCGFFLVMLGAGLVSTTLLTLFPAFENVLRFVGAAYILYLAYSILKATYTFDEQKVKPLGFSNGFTLQLVNPKGLIYGLTLFSAFLASITSNFALVILAAAIITFISFCSISTWTLFGTIIRTYLHQPRVKMTVNVILALLLVYTAVDLAGFI
ncbi:MAG: LysE family transporter [Anaerolineae bacterium]|nr:LysE family transporter [Anaerolineae bacterium]